MRGLVSSAAFAGADSLSATSEQSARRVVMILGDSNVAGFVAGTENETGFRSTFQRILAAEGVNFRMVGQGLGALDAAGLFWGSNARVDDFHDKPVPRIGDVRHWGFGGRRISHSNVATAINATTNALTVPGNNLAVGVAFTLDLSETDDPPVLAVNQGVYYVATKSGDDITLAQYEGSTTPIDITYAGSGTVRVCEGLVEMLPGIADDCDEVPTDIVAGGGTNDISALLAGGASEADALEILKQRELAYEDKLNELFPGVNIHRICILRFEDDTASAIAATNVALSFNAWLVARAGSLRGNWNVVDATALPTASSYIDNGHLARVGYEVWGKEIARNVLRGMGNIGSEATKVPRPFVRRPAQACIELRATTERVAFPAQAALNPGSNSYFFAVWFMPFALPSGANVIVQQENPYSEGNWLTTTNARLNLYWRSAGACIAGSAATECLKKYRWNRILAFFDAARRQAALFCNGTLLRRVFSSTFSPVTSQDGWAIGAIPSFSSALGLYQGFTMGHGASLSIEDALKWAVDDYYDGVHPPGTTYYAPMNEGTGTSLASTVHDTTAGTLVAASGGGWIGAGRYPKIMEDGYMARPFDSRVANVTSAYTATYWERINCDPTAGVFTVDLPTAVGHDGKQIAVNNVSASVNVVTLDGFGSETIDGSATIPGLVTARGGRVIEARGGNWVTVAVS